MPASLVIDGGGSGSRARLVDGEGRRTTVHGGPLNITYTPFGDVCRRIDELLAQLPSVPAGSRVSVGVAGGGNAERAGELSRRLRERLATDGVAVGRDIDLLLAQLAGDGAAVVAGTGAIVAARGPRGEVVVDGHGLLVGDRGGGAWIVLETLRAALRELDLGGTSPPVLDALLDAAGVDSPRRLAFALSPEGAVDAAKVAALAPVVLANGDQAPAQVVLARAVTELSDGVRAALGRCGAGAGAEVVAAGGLFQAPRFFEPLRAACGGGMRRVDPLDGRLEPTC